MDENVKQNTNEPRGAKNFVRLGRYVWDDFQNGEITLGEFIVLTALHIKANPHTGSCSVRYGELSLEFHGKFKPNAITKTMLALRKKNYISFAEHQGSRSKCAVLIHHYPLSNKTFVPPPASEMTDDGRSLETKDSNQIAEDSKKEVPVWQKSEEDIYPLEEPIPIISSLYESRGANNEYERTNNKKSKSISYSEKYDVEKFHPDSYEEQICHDVAIKLGETDMRSILSMLRNGGLYPIERAWGIIKEDRSGNIRNKRGYFNALVQKFIRGEQ